MAWLKMALNKISLRKGLLRSDIHIAFPSYNEMNDDIQITSLVKSYLEVATIRGLDIIGIVSDWLRPGLIAKQIVEQKNIDVFVLVGQELVTEEGMTVLAFNIPQELSQRMNWETCFKNIHETNGFAIAVRPSRRFMNRLNKIVDESWAPEGIEVYNPGFNEYIDINVDYRYEFFMTSAAKTPNDLLNSKINTQNDRSWWVKHGILQEDTGKDYVPRYLNDPYRAPGQF